MQHAYTVNNKSGAVVSHHYTTTLTLVSNNAPNRFRVVGLRTPGGGMVKVSFLRSPTRRRERPNPLHPPQKGEEAPNSSSHHTTWGAV